MDLEITWLDPLLMVLLAGAVVLGVRRGVATLIVALGSLVAWYVLNILGIFLAPIGFLLALLAGYGLGVASRGLVNGSLQNVNDSDPLTSLLGGLGGLLLGLGLVVALTLSFPTSPNATTGSFTYPSTRLPGWLYDGVRGSAIQRYLQDPRGLNIWEGPSFVRGLVLADRASSNRR